MTRVISARRAQSFSRPAGRLLLRGLELQRFLLELIDGPAIALVDLLGELPRLEPLHDAALDEERLARERAVLAGEVADERRHVGRVPHVELAFVLGCLHGVLEPGRLLGETRAGGGGDGVRADAVPAELEGRDVRERRDAGLRRAVVCLARVAEQARRRRGVNDRRLHLLAGLALLPPIRGGVAGLAEMTVQVDVVDRVPLMLGNVYDYTISQDTYDVHDHV